MWHERLLCFNQFFLTALMHGTTSEIKNKFIMSTPVLQHHSSNQCRCALNKAASLTRVTHSTETSSLPLLSCVSALSLTHWVQRLPLMIIECNLHIWLLTFRPFPSHPHLLKQRHWRVQSHHVAGAVKAPATWAPLQWEIPRDAHPTFWRDIDGPYWLAWWVVLSFFSSSLIAHNGVQFLRLSFSKSSITVSTSQSTHSYSDPISPSSTSLCFPK